MLHYRSVTVASLTGEEGDFVLKHSLTLSLSHPNIAQRAGVRSLPSSEAAGSAWHPPRTPTTIWEPRGSQDEPSSSCRDGSHSLLWVGFLQPSGAGSDRSFHPEGHQGLITIFCLLSPVSGKAVFRPLRSYSPLPAVYSSWCFCTRTLLTRSPLIKTAAAILYTRDRRDQIPLIYSSHIRVHG